MLYGAAVWDPVLIIAQIVTVQSLFYLTLGLFQSLFLGTSVSRLSILYLFSWRTFSLATYIGCVSAFSLLITSGLGAVFLMWIVERAKKCLDFSSTCFIFHLIFCWSYDGFPRRLEWWLVNGVGLVIMSLFGEWLCLRREMQEIPLNTLRGRGASSGSLASSGAPGGSSGQGGGGGGTGGSGAVSANSSAVQLSSAAVAKSGNKSQTGNQLANAV